MKVLGKRLLVTVLLTLLVLGVYSLTTPRHDEIHSAVQVTPVSVPAEPPVATPVETPNTWADIYTSNTALPGNWFVKDIGGWGATDLNSGDVFIAPRTPKRLLKSVMLHESVHVMQHEAYGGYDAVVAGLSAHGGMEVIADCGAIQLGATWTNYTDTCTPEQNEVAKHILKGERP